MTEEFEKWAKGEGFDLARWADTDDYADLQTSDAWWVWQASRKQALEEAAEIADQLWVRAGDADEVASAIRALQQQ